MLTVYCQLGSILVNCLPVDSSHIIYEMSNFVVREAVREDCNGIYELVRELANFENMPDEPKIGPEVLQRDGFDAKNPFFKCFVAERNETHQLVGYALFFNSYSTWLGPSLYLEDIYVTPDVRGSGIGSALFDRVVKVANDTGCCRLDFTVLSWNPATEFYKRKGAIDLTGSENWHHYRLERKSIEELCRQKFI